MRPGPFLPSDCPFCLGRGAKWRYPEVVRKRTFIADALGFAMRLARRSVSLCMIVGDSLPIMADLPEQEAQ